MAKFRKIHTSFWDDSLIEQFSPEDKYFYLFLMTNPLCTECGIYVLSIKKMVYYTGYNEDAVKCILKRFSDHGRIVYDTSTSEICIIKKPNYIDRLGKPVEDCLKSEFDKVKNISLIYSQLAAITRPEVRIVYDTWTIRRQEKEKEEELKKESAGAISPAPPHSNFGFNSGNLAQTILRPMASDFNGLPARYSEDLRRLVKSTKCIDIDEDQVTGVWEVFKSQSLTGIREYESKDAVYRHFVNFGKLQHFKTKRPNEPKPREKKQNGKVVGVEFMNDFKQCLMSDGSIKNLTTNQSDSAKFLGVNPDKITKD